MRILITTVPFAVHAKIPLELLTESGCEYVINPLGRKLTEQDLFDMVDDFEVIIAGTEIISKRVMEKAKKLKLISRVGIGLDGVDLCAAQELGIKVSYTPGDTAPDVDALP